MDFDRDEPPKQMRPYIRSKKALRNIPEGERNQLIGRTRADESYGVWLKRQPAKFQDEVLGVAKGKLFRDGKVSIERFVDISTGREYTLDELRKRIN